MKIFGTIALVHAAQAMRIANIDGTDGTPTNPVDQSQATDDPATAPIEASVGECSQLTTPEQQQFCEEMYNGIMANRLASDSAGDVMWTTTALYRAVLV